MSKSVQINIPKPCHENWQNMTPREQGRYCGSCQKIVVDFSMMSDKEMLDTISKTAGQPVCGRFANDQLNRKIERATDKRRFSLRYVWNLLLASVLLIESCDESTTGEIDVRPSVEIVEEETMGKVADDGNPACSQSQTEIKGAIFNEDSGLPVAGAQVRIPGIKQTAVTDAMGKFSLLSDNVDFVILEVSAPHFSTKTVQLDNKTDWVHVKVSIKERFMMGAVLVQENDETINRAIENWKKEK